MYVLQEKPDQNVVMSIGSNVKPLATLRDQYGGVAHIIEDDHCYVLILMDKEGRGVRVKYWFPEAVDAMKKLPTPRYP